MSTLFYLGGGLTEFVGLNTAFFFHGGPFIVGDLDDENARCLRYFEQIASVVVSVTYRQAREHP